MESSKRALLSEVDLEVGGVSSSHPLALQRRCSLQWSNIRAYVGKKSGKQVLFDCSGNVKPGQVLAIMGASGAGKTTLLNTLADQTYGTYTEGDILLNGEARKKSFRRQTAYVRQDDVLSPFLTVKETLMYAAKLRLADLSDADRLKRVNEVITELGLEKARDTRIGSEDKRGISGGERKRVSIGMELISDPGLIFVDEGTTGLDSAAAYSLMKLLNNLARSGRTIVTTIHQPRSNIYELFDQLLLLSDGKVAYRGPASQAIDFFKEAGFECNRFMNPADFYIDTLAGPIADRCKVIENFRNREKKTQEDAGRPNVEGSKEKSADVGQYARNWFIQVWVLTCRNLQLILRDPLATWVALFQSLFVCALVMIIFWQLGNSQASIISRNGALFFVLTNQVFSSQASLGTFMQEKSLFLREWSSGWYRVSSHVISKIVSEFPTRIIFPLIFAGACYWGVGFNSQWERFLWFALIIVIVNNVAAAFITFCGAVSANQGVAGALSAIIIVLQMLFGGFFSNGATIPVWIGWLKWVSIFNYGYSALMINEYRGKTFTCTPEEKMRGCILDGEAVLATSNINTDDFNTNLIVLASMWLFWRVATYAVLRFQTWRREHR